MNFVPETNNNSRQEAWNRGRDNAKDEGNVKLMNLHNLNQNSSNIYQI